MSAFLSSTRQSARVKKKYWNQFAFAVGGSTTIRDSKRKGLKNSDRQASRKLFNWHTFKCILSFLIFTPKIRRKPVRQKKLINWTLSLTKMAIIICGNKRYFSNCHYFWSDRLFGPFTPELIQLQNLNGKEISSFFSTQKHSELKLFQSGKDQVGPHIHKKGIFSGISYAVPRQVSGVVCNLISATTICGCSRGAW